MLITKSYYSDRDHVSISSFGIHVDHSVIHEAFPQHRHSFCEAFIILSGQADHLLGPCSYPLRRGNVFAIKGSTAHGFANVRELEIINLMYDPRVLQQSAFELQTIPGFASMFLLEPELRPREKYTSMLTLDEPSLTYVCAMTDFLQEQLARGEPALGTAIRLNFMALIAYLSTKYDADADVSESVKALAGAMHYMENNLNKPIRLREVAEKVHLSARQLERVFQNLYDEKPMVYLQRIRLRNALTLLLQQKDTVAAAAQKSGFEDPAYFTRVFRDWYGLTPQAARKLLNGLGSAL